MNIGIQHHYGNNKLWNVRGMARTFVLISLMACDLLFLLRKLPVWCRTLQCYIFCFLISPLKVMSFIILYLKALGQFLDCLLDGRENKWGFNERARIPWLLFQSSYLFSMASKPNKCHSDLLMTYRPKEVPFLLRWVPQKICCKGFEFWNTFSFMSLVYPIVLTIGSGLNTQNQISNKGPWENSRTF